jgi:Tol biopolymer transport system component
MVTRAPGGAQADGASADPALSPTGKAIAFDTSATNLAAGDTNGAIRDVIVFDGTTGERRLVSAGGNGPSTDPALAAGGQIVVFTSQASNLVPGDTNGVSDIFIREGNGPLRLVSVGLGGAPANRPSSEPDISRNGRYVVFTSAASNLVPGDTNGRPDVFRRDLATGTTIRVSVTNRGRQANEASGAPAISADGNVVSFASKASNLVGRDTNHVADVFVRDIRRRRTERVSVSTLGVQQNKAVIAPFSQISDVSRDGRFVVFDSDATNLVPRDENRRTDVFRRDRKTGRTQLMSVSSTGYEGNNDSFAPSITANGRFITFESFASNLARHDGPREDIFVRDTVIGTTSIVNVPASGGRRSPELVKQLLQRPVLSEDGTVAAFISTAPNLVTPDDNGVSDVFLRAVAAPFGKVVRQPRAARRPVVVLGADDPLATDFVCRIDGRSPFLCARGAVRFPGGLSPGRHVLRARAGGPGMLFDPHALVVHATVTRGGRR